MLRVMLSLTVLGAVSTLATWRTQVALAFVVGASLGILNFRWLWRTGKVLMEVQTGRVPRKTIFLIVLRYPLVLGALLVLYYTGWLRPLPVVAGLLVPGLSLLLVSLLLLHEELHRKQTA
jgi:hypothetical protein